MKTLNKILSVITALTMILCGLAACDDNTQTPGDDPVSGSYTVRCVDENGAPVSGVLVLFTAKDGSTELAITTSDGVLSVESEAGMSSVTVNTVPTGFACENKVYEFNGANELTIVFTADAAADTTVSYTVTVVDGNGDPVSGVELQFCDEESCRLPVVTDEIGKVCENYIASVYHVTVNDVPDGYFATETVYYFGEGETEMTIVLSAE